MKIGILGASLDTGNMGVSVLAAGAIQNVLRQFPQAEVYFLNYALHSENVVVGSGARRQAYQLIPIRFSKYLFQRNNIAVLTALALVLRALPVESWRKMASRANSVLKQIMSIDTFVSVAGGDSFSDIYGLRRFFYVVLPQVLVLLLGKRLVLLPQTIGPFRSKIARVVARQVVRGASLVYSRDSAGVDATRALAGLRPGPAAKVKFGYDLGFKVAPAPVRWKLSCGSPSETFAKGGVVGINISGLLWNEGTRFGLALDYKEFVLSSIRYFAGAERANVLLVPHVVCPGMLDSDPEAIKEAYSLCVAEFPDRVKIVEPGLAYDETKYVIGCCDYFIGARMHACIAALSQSVPCSALAYSGKFAGVMESVGADAITIDLRTSDLITALAVLKRNFRDRSRMRRLLDERMPPVKASVALL
jgi:colanic acid/amylovoran biosynthesis protein